MCLFLLFGFFICGYDIVCVDCRYGIASDIYRHNIVSVAVGEESRVLGLILGLLMSNKDVFVYRAYFGFVNVYFQSF